MTDSTLASTAWRLLVALAIGLFIGTERERRKGEGATRGAAGLRTFALVSLLGGIAQQLDSPVLLALAAAFVGLAAVASYWLGDRKDPGLTTEVTLMVTFLLGVLAQTRPMPALGTGIVVTLLLAVKMPLHRLVREVLSERELGDGLIFSIAALVVLPMLPDRTVDPLGLINPFAFWRMAVVLMGLSAAGYVAMRTLGPRYGAAIAGFASGFVSSTASIAAMGGKARSDETLSTSCASGAMASIVGSLVFLVSLVATADLDVVKILMKPLAAAILPTLGYTLALTGFARNETNDAGASGKAFDVVTVATFSAVVLVFALVSTELVLWLGPYGMVGSAAATGLIDVHAAAVSVATLIASGKVTAATGAISIIVALSANMLSKIPAAFAFGPKRFSVMVGIGLVVLLCGLWSGFAWQVFS